MGNLRLFYHAAAAILLCAPPVRSQESWTLSRCIEYALENNLQVKKSRLGTYLSKQNAVQSKASLLPSLNGFATHNYNFGKTIDPFTNQFASDRVQSNSLGLSGNLNLFSGFQTVNTVKQRSYEYLASQHDLEKVKNDISLSIATAYLQVLFAEEQASIASGQLQLTKMQVDRTRKLVQAGSLSEGGLLDVEAQLAAEELSLINAENRQDLAYLSLRQLLELESGQDFRIVRPEIQVPESPEVGLTPGQVYDAALQRLPDILGAEYRLMGTERGLALSKGGRSPQLTLSGSYGTGYSGANREITGATFKGFESIAATASGEPVVAPMYEYSYGVRSFEDQFNDNLNQTIGLRLSVPVFNGWATRTAISRAKISREMAEADLEQTRRQIEKNIHQAYADAQAALKKYRATKGSLEALRKSFDYTEKKFNLGMVNSVDYTTAKNNLARAESDLLQAKYDYVFRMKILEFYQGKPLSL